MNAKIEQIIWTDPPKAKISWSDGDFSGVETVEMPGWTQPASWTAMIDQQKPVLKQIAANELSS